MKSPVRFAVIGCGQLAFRRHLPNLMSSPRTRLQVCCDASDEALQRCRRELGVEQLTRDFHEAIRDPGVDAICLATTERLRLPVIAEAATAGKPIYVEKPLASTLEEVYAIQRIIHEAGIPFCVGHNRRASPAMLDAHGIFRRHMDDPQPCPWRFEREPGRPPREGDGAGCMSVRINDDCWSWKSWVFDPTQTPHGPLLFEMTHFTDLCNWFLAAEPRRVVALGDGMINHGVVIEYDTGEIATITMTASGTFGYAKELYEIFGHGAAVVVDQMVEVRTAGIEGAPSRLTYPLADDALPAMHDAGDGLAGFLAKRRKIAEQAVAAGRPMDVSAVEADKGHAHALDRFVSQILGEGPEVCGVDDAVLATRVAFAAVRSVQERRPVEMSEV